MTRPQETAGNLPLAIEMIPHVCAGAFSIAEIAGLAGVHPFDVIALGDAMLGEVFGADVNR
jgi:hypothetical protein